MKPQIGVIGFAGPEEYPRGKGPAQKHLQLAFEVGFLIAQEGWTLLTGGKGGVMLEANKGAKKNNGITVGFIRGSKRKKANAKTGIEIVTGFENGGSEFTLVNSADALVVIGGGAGTIQEIALAYRTKKPIFILSPVPVLENALFLDDRKNIQLKKVQNPRQAIAAIKQTLKRN